MALSIKINGVERAQDVPLRSLRLGNALTADVDTADFHVIAGNKPQEGQEIIVEDVALEATVDSQADWQAGTIPAEADDATNPGAVQLAVANVQTDPSFEVSGGAGTFAGRWSVQVTNGAAVTLDNTDPFHGTWAAKMTQGAVVGTCWLFSYYQMPLTSGPKWGFAMVKGTAGKRFQGRIHNYTTGLSHYGPTIYLSGDWEVYLFEVTPGAGDCRLIVHSLDANSVVFIDVAGISLVQVTEPILTYPPTATITTKELDLGAVPERQGALQVTAATPSGTAVEVTEVSNRWPGGDWGPWTPVEPGGIIPATMERRQIWQAKVYLTTTDTTVTPELQQLRLVFDEDSENGREFGGRVVSATQLEPVPGAVQYQVRCNDWMKAGDRRFVIGERFVNWTRGAIARYLVGKYASGFTATIENVPDGPIISGDYRVDYRRLSEVFRELCEMTAGDWYWDPYKGLHMFEVGSEQASAPFRLSDDGAADAEHPATLSWTPDVTDLGTRVYVRGGDYFPPNSYPQTILCDGQARAWLLAYKPKDLVITIQGDPTPQTVAVDDLLNQVGDPDWTFNFQEKLLKRGPGKPTPAAGTVLNLTYRPFLPVRLRLDDNDAQQRLAAIEGGDGVYEATIVDESLDSVEQARLVGEAYLREHANALITGGYSTLRKGLRAGQKQRVELAARGISQDILIGAVMKERLPGGRWRSSVVFASRLIGGIEDLILRLLRDSRKIEVRDDEILEIVVAMKSLARGEDSLTVAVVPRESRVEYARANRSEVS